MKLGDLQVDTVYEVSRLTRHFNKGEHIWIDSSHCHLNCVESAGWYEANEVEEHNILEGVILNVAEGWKVDTVRGSHTRAYQI